MPTTCIVLNPKAGGSGEAVELRRAVAATPDVDLFVSEHPGHARELAARALRDGFDQVIAAGGDGTINEVLNGLGEDLGGAAFGVIPLGTGNDLARTLAIPLDPVAAFERALEGERRSLDVIRVENEDEVRYALNVCSGGFTGEVKEALPDELKDLSGRFAYLVAGARVLSNPPEFETRIAWGEEDVQVVDAVNVVVANGRTAGGGGPVAPRANPEDGLLDVVVTRSCTGAELAGLAAKALAGDYLDSDLVLYRRVSRLRLASRPGMAFSVDGEPMTEKPLSFDVLPGALRVVVGRDYRAVPPAATEPEG